MCIAGRQGVRREEVDEGRGENNANPTWRIRWLICCPEDEAKKGLNFFE